MKFQVIDLFCGAGGVTEGIQKAIFCKEKIAEVVACINHDDTAIRSHQANHRSTLHFTEDIRAFDLHKLPVLDRSKIIVLWASLECTNFSKAKGGKPRDADSRTLAEHLYRYIEYIDPDYVMIENVREFMAWGMLDKNGKPVSMDKGRDYLRWVKKIINYGYNYDYRLLDAADFGAYCLRKRYFGMFAKKGLPIKFPQPTHSRKLNPMFKTKQWKPVKECLDLNDEGNSIFGRKKSLLENTLKRILEGLKKFATYDKFIFTSVSSSYSENGIKYNPGKSIDDVSPCVPTHNRLGVVFLSKYYSGHPEHKNIGIDEPSGTIKTIDNQAVVQCEFLHTYHGKNGKSYSTNRPTVTIPTKDEISLVVPVHFLDCQYSTGRKNQSVNEPSGSILTNPKERLVTCQFIDMQYSDSKNTRDIKSPCGSVTKNPKANLVSPKFIDSTQFNNKPSSINEPAKTLTANRKRMYLISPILGRSNKKLFILIYEDDSDTMKLIKQFMAENGIIDIKMRMLKVNELKKIMGLKEKYILLGNQTKQKWMIGNMVHPIVPKKWFEDLYKALLEQEELSKAA